MYRRRNGDPGRSPSRSTSCDQDRTLARAAMVCRTSRGGLVRLDRGPGRPRRADFLVDRRQLVGNAAVAVDAGLPLAERDAVRAHRAPPLLRKVHELEVVAVAAFLRVVRAHARPLALGELDALLLELLGRVD